MLTSQAEDAERCSFRTHRVSLSDRRAAQCSSPGLERQSVVIKCVYVRWRLRLLQPFCDVYVSQPLCLSSGFRMMELFGLVENRYSSVSGVSMVPGTFNTFPCFQLHSDAFLAQPTRYRLSSALSSPSTAEPIQGTESKQKPSQDT